MVSSLSGFVRRHKVLVIRVATIGGMACVLAAIGYALTEVNPFLVLAAIAVPIWGFVLSRRIELGLVAMLLSAVFIRFRLPTGTESEIVMSLLLCVGILGIWVARMVVEDKRLALEPTPINRPLLAFVVTVFISLFWGQAFRDPLVHHVGSRFVPWAAAAVMALLPVVCLLVANLVQHIRWLQAMAWVFLAEGLVSLVASLVMDLGIGPGQAVRSFVVDNGIVWVTTHGLFSMWYVSFALALALFNRRLHWGWRLALLAYTAGWVYWGFFLRIVWLSGWVPTFAAAAVVAFFRSKWLFAVLVVVLVVGAGGYYWRTWWAEERQVSGMTRLAAYAINWRITGKHLLFGTGPAGYASYYMSYFPTEAMASHSNYIDIVAQTGIVGTFFILWFFGAQTWGGYKLRHMLKDRGDFAESWCVAVVAGTAGCVLAMGLGDWLLPFVYTQGIVGFGSAMINWFFMGSLWALRHSLPQRHLL